MELVTLPAQRSIRYKLQLNAPGAGPLLPDAYRCCGPEHTGQQLGIAEEVTVAAVEGDEEAVCYIKIPRVLLGLQGFGNEVLESSISPLLGLAAAGAYQQGGGQYEVQEQSLHTRRFRNWGKIRGWGFMGDGSWEIVHSTWIIVHG